MTGNTIEEVAQWFAGKVAPAWFVDDPQISADGDEIQVIGTIASPEGEFPATVDYDAACAVAIAEFRQNTRDQRIAIAQQAEIAWSRKVSWGVRCGQHHTLFTHATVPVMTRLGLSERQVLDTLVAANVARSRSDALGWCVRQIAERDADWLDRLRDALKDVDRVRDEAP